MQECYYRPEVIRQEIGGCCDTFHLICPRYKVSQGTSYISCKTCLGTVAIRDEKCDSDSQQVEVPPTMSQNSDVSAQLPVNCGKAGQKTKKCLNRKPYAGMESVDETLLSEQTHNG